MCCVVVCDVLVAEAKSGVGIFQHPKRGSFV